MESSNSHILENILEQQRDFITARRVCDTNETNALEEVGKSLKQKEDELEERFEKRFQVRFENWDYYFKDKTIAKLF